MYTNCNYKTKKALKEAVALYLEGKGPTVEYHNPGPFGTPMNGWIVIEGPHFPKPHRWAANCFAKDGKIINVK